MNTAQILTSPLKTDEDLPEGTRRVIDGLERVFYDGYWIKTYPVPKDTLEAKKKLLIKIFKYFALKKITQLGVHILCDSRKKLLVLDRSF